MCGGPAQGAGSRTNSVPILVPDWYGWLASGLTRALCSGAGGGGTCEGRDPRCRLARSRSLVARHSLFAEASAKPSLTGSWRLRFLRSALSRTTAARCCGVGLGVGCPGRLLVRHRRAAAGAAAPDAAGRSLWAGRAGLALRACGPGGPAGRLPYRRLARPTARRGGGRLRCCFRSICESEGGVTLDACSSSRAGVSGFGAATFAHRPQRARRRRRRALLHLQARDDSRPTLLVLLGAGGVGDVGCSCWSARKEVLDERAVASQLGRLA
jgi:hypothetical protein